MDTYSQRSKVEDQQTSLFNGVYPIDSPKVGILKLNHQKFYVSTSDTSKLRMPSFMTPRTLLLLSSFLKRPHRFVFALM